MMFDQIWEYYNIYTYFLSDFLFIFFSFFSFVMMTFIAKNNKGQGAKVTQRGIT